MFPVLKNKWINQTYIVVFSNKLCFFPLDVHGQTSVHASQDIVESCVKKV